MKCDSIKKNVNKVCIGDLDKRIKIQTSSIAPNNSPNSVATTAFVTIATVWAMIKTSTNRDFIDGVQVENGSNTDFYIRYTSSIDFEKQLWIEYNNNKFKINSVDNIDKDDLFVRLRSTEKGDKTILANLR